MGKKSRLIVWNILSIRLEAKNNFWRSRQKKTLVVFFEKACGVKFLKHGGAVNFSRVVGVDPPLAHLWRFG